MSLLACYIRDNIVAVLRYCCKYIYVIIFAVRGYSSTVSLVLIIFEPTTTTTL